MFSGMLLGLIWKDQDGRLLLYNMFSQNTSVERLIDRTLQITPWFGQETASTSCEPTSR